MTRHYFIVARDQTSLCEYLARQFASEENVEVFLDRRSGHERRVADGHGDTSNGEAATDAISRSSTPS